MNAKINPPSLPPGAPHRVAECTFAAEPSFQALVDAAKQSGWTEEEVAVALFDLAVQRILTLNTALTTEEAIGIALQKSSLIASI